MLSLPSRFNMGLRTSPWLILGAAAILMVVVVVLAFQNIRRDQRHMNEVLSTKGVAVIRAVEAGARTGMMGMRWGGAQVQRLLEETGQLPEVLYIAILSQDGRALAHSDASRVGYPLHADRLPVHTGPDFEEAKELIALPDGMRVFEIHREFRPVRQGGRFREHGMGPGMRRPDGEREWLDLQEGARLIVVGLDVTPYEDRISADIRNTVLLSLVLLLLGFAGFISLFWMNSYRAARRSLQDTSAFADEVVANLPVGLIATDREGRIAFFNSAAETISGVARQSALGRPPESVLPEPLRDLFRGVESGKSITDREMTCTFANGKTIPVSAGAARIANEEGRFVGNVLILRDLRELRRLQAEVRRQEKLAALGGLAAGVAHEIRNPLSSIKGLAIYFGAKFSEGSQDRKLAAVMTQEVDRLNRVIGELLEFARAPDIKMRMTDINALLEHSLQLIARDADAKKIVIRRDFSDDPCHILVDPDRLTQCLLNLYLNAIQAMPDGGCLTVGSQTDAGSRLLIQVEDTGGGIPSEDIDRIFNPYYTTKPQGTGLGLAIVHKIVEAHDGGVQVDSTPGKGTRFTLTFACRSGAAGDKTDEHDSSKHPGGGR
jgi:two-component system, NtrC family, sensor histidine kinase HydH